MRLQLALRPARIARLLGATGAVLVLLVSGCTTSDDSADESTSTVPVSTASTVAEVLALDRPVVLAHAGGENAAPDSTPFAFAEAVEAGVDVLDVDVRLTGDGVLVVHRDEDVDRTTGSTGEVAEKTYDELHALDNAFWFTDACSACTDQPRDAYRYRGVRTGEIAPPDAASPADFAITRLDDLLARYPSHVFNIEIKGSVEDSVPAAEELARILTERDRLDAAIVTASDDELAEAFHQLAPQVVVSPGLDATTAYVLEGRPLPEGRDILQVQAELEGLPVLTPELVEAAESDGHVLWISPNDREIEDAEGYEDLLDQGFDGINAADPAVAVEVVRGR